MRWSISTKVFLGFAAVIFAFGAVSLYGIYRMDQLRLNVRLVRVEVLPLTVELDAIVADLKTYEEELGRTRDRDLVRLRSYFPNFRPFDRLEDVNVRIERIGQYDKAPLSREERERLILQSTRVTRLQEGREFWLRSTKTPKSVLKEATGVKPKSITNKEAYDLKARTYISALQREEFQRARLLQEDLVSNALLGLLVVVILCARDNTKRIAKSHCLYDNEHGLEFSLPTLRTNTDPMVNGPENV